MPSLAKHHFLRAYLPLMVPFRTRFSRREVVHVAYVQGLAGYLYTRWWSSHIPTLRFHGTRGYPSRPPPSSASPVRGCYGVEGRRPCCLSAVEFRPALPTPDK